MTDRDTLAACEPQHHDWRICNVSPDDTAFDLACVRCESEISLTAGVRVAPSPEAPGLREAAEAYVALFDTMNYPDTAAMYPHAIKAALAALPPRDVLDVECPECGEGIRHEWPCSHVERCDEPGCDREADCGWPTKAGEATFSGDPESDGYRRTCGLHMRWAAQSKEPTDE